MVNMKDKRTNNFEDEIVKEVVKDFESRREKRRPVELTWRLNMNFLMGNQYASITPTGDIDDYGRQYYWQEREVYNHIAPIVETRLAKLTRVRSGVSIRPKTSDECDVQSAKFSTAVLQSIMEENGFSRLLQKANGWAETTGSVFYKVSWNGEKGREFALDGKIVHDGDVEITVCPPFEIYPENLQIEEINDQPSVIHAKAYSVEEVEKIWGVKVKGGDVNVFSLDKTGVSGGFGYTASVPKIVDEVRHDAVIVIERYEKPSANFKNGRLIAVAGDKLLYMGDLPYINGERGDRVYPFIKQNSLDNVGVFFGTSVIERIIPVQRAYNALKNRKHEFLNRLSMGVLATEDGSVDTDALEAEGLAPGKILIYRQGSTPPALLNPGSIPHDFYLEENRLLEEFTMISGVSEVMKYSQLPENVTSGVAISLLIEQDDTRISVTADNIRNAVREVGKHILRLYKQFARTRRLKSIAGENGQLEMLYFGASDLTSDDLVFDTENELIETPSSRKNMVLELMQLGLLTDENGRYSERTKCKILETLGFGNWENSRDISELHVKKALRENRAFSEKQITPDASDDHEIHIEEHTKFLLSPEFDENFEMKNVITAHINKHREFIESANISL